MVLNSADLTKNLQDIARERLGIDAFRPGQEETIQAVIHGRDTLAVFPTGFGKSAIYQLAGAFLPGPTVVVSPLIALQQDQASTLQDRDIGGAAIVNSTVAATEQQQTLTALEQGRLEFIFLAPEQFSREDIIARVKQAQPSLFVIDEAHCISEWGHDFRPDYLRLGTVIEALGHPTVLALTATASELVRHEIIERLGMRAPKIIVKDMDRPNIFLSVLSFEKEEKKRRELLDRVSNAQTPGIIYVATRRSAEEITNDLLDRGITAAFYHGGMGKHERVAVHNEFMTGQTPIIVATSAFGMGVDKPDVRFVFHYHASDSLDAYYQEIGRAGRDGERADALLFYRPGDLNLYKFFAGGGRVDTEDLASVADAVHEQGELEQDTLQEKTGLSKTKLQKALTHLQEQGVVENSVTGKIIASDEAVDIHQAAEEAAKAQERHHTALLQKLERMRVYSELRDCRRQYLLEYFGEEKEPCGFCDNCKRGLPDMKSQDEDHPFPAKTRVIHQTWGKGVVMGYEKGNLVVHFDEEGEKVLLLDFVLKNDLLSRAT